MLAPAAQVCPRYFEPNAPEGHHTAGGGPSEFDLAILLFGLGFPSLFLKIINPKHKSFATNETLMRSHETIQSSSAVFVAPRNPPFHFERGTTFSQSQVHATSCSELQSLGTLGPIFQDTGDEDNKMSNILRFSYLSCW